MEEESAGSSTTIRTRIRGIYKLVFIGVTVASVLIGAYWAFHWSWFGFLELNGIMYLLISLLLPLSFLSIPARKGSAGKVPIYDVILAVASFVIPFFFFLHALDIRLIGWEYRAPVEAVIMAAILWGLVIEAARRVAGLGLVIVGGLFSIYPLFSGYLPGILYGYQFTFPDTVGMHVFSMEGMLGIPMQVFYYLLIGYLLFGVVMQFTGGGQFFIGLALALLGHVRGGPAKVAVFSSALYGTISGSSIANVMVTGCFTIPTMKRIGYRSDYAAAVETCASLGGQLTPPIMATTAFIMADWLGISYATVALAAAMPAVVYYVSLMVQVDGYAALHGLKGLPREECPSLWSVMKKGWVYIIVFAVLLYLMFKMLWIAQAPYIATGCLLVLSMIPKSTRFDLKTLLGAILDLGKAFYSLVAVMTCVGLIISGVIFTGIATSIGSEIIVLVGGNIFLVVIVTVSACIILGMGVSLTACYIIAALLLAPALVQVGFLPLVAHFFILYYVNLSGLTPPVCLTAYTAAGLANAPPMKTGFTAARIGSVLFIMPLFIIMRPELLLIGTPLEIIIAAIEALIGGFSIGSALEGYVFKLGKLNIFSRLLLGFGGLSLLMPEPFITFTGIGMIIASIVINLILSQRSKI